MLRVRLVNFHMHEREKNTGLFIWLLIGYVSKKFFFELEFSCVALSLFKECLVYGVY